MSLKARLDRLERRAAGQTPPPPEPAGDFRELTAADYARLPIGELSELLDALEAHGREADRLAGARTPVADVLPHLRPETRAAVEAWLKTLGEPDDDPRTPGRPG